MINPSSVTQARSSAIKYLSIREHSRFELEQKLTRKGFEKELIDSVLSQLQAGNLLSDERFAESYVRMRTQKGFGPLRIQQELRERGIAEELVKDVLETNETSWVTLASNARQKRFGEDLPKGQREFAKQARFLQYRGFAPSQIKDALLTDL
jgi:regulatory protein